MSRTDLPIRVAVLSKPLDSWTSGSGHHLDELMRAVLDANDGSFDFTFAHYSKSDNPVYGRVRELIIPRNPLAASRVLARSKFDIIHYSPITIYTPLWGISAKKTATVHGIEETLFPEGYSLVQRLNGKLLQPAYMRRMDGIATVSQASRQYFIDHYRIQSERVFITTNGLDPAYRRLSREELAALALPVSDKRPFILHLSRYSTRKNPEGVIGGFARFIKSTGKDYILVCAGKGWDGEEAREIARREGISDRYFAPGFIDQPVAIGLLNVASAFLFPSFAEGFGMPNIEAMACGCPVVTSGVFAIPEVVADAAIVLRDERDADEIAQALATATGDGENKKALVERGLERAGDFKWEDSSRALLDYWKGLARAGKAGIA
jgi:glycosyltransferase involved in cell wall biosynthesis